VQYFSHIGQDKWVSECLHLKKKGFFLDFGAFDGKTISNTYFLEKELEWNGICVEPNPFFYSRLCGSRNCTLINSALWPISRQSLQFCDAHGLSSIVEFRDCDVNAERRKEATKALIEVDTINPTELLRRFNAPTLIDYLSLDVEGCEYEVLEAIDLTTYHIALMTIEHNHVTEKRDKIRKYLTNNRYEYVQNRNEDWFFNLEYISEAVGPGGNKIVSPVEIFTMIYRTYPINE